MKKYTLSLIIMIFLLLAGLTSINPSIAEEEPNLTADEALEIAMSHPEVEEWLKSYEFKTEEPYYANGSWITVFTLEADSRKELVVYVDDETGEVTEIHTFDIDDDDYYNDKQVDAAINYIKKLDMLSAFIKSYPDLLWYGYAYDDIIDLYTNGEYNENYIWMSIQLKVSDNETNYEFALISISSNSLFGYPQYNFDEVVNLLSDHPEVQEFVDLHPEYFVNFQLHYKLDDEGEKYHHEIYYQTRDYRAEGSYEDDVRSSSESLCYCGYYGWLKIVVDDQSGNVLEIFGTYTADHTDAEILELIEENEVIGPWLESLEEFRVNAYFNGYDAWWIDIWSTNSKDYAYVSVNDTTEEIIDYYIFIPIPATRTKTQIESLVLEHLEISEWINKVGEYSIQAYYDDQGTWYVSLRHPVLFQNYAYATVDDVSGKVSDVLTYIIDANLSLDDLYDVLRGANLQDFLESFPDAVVYVYYSDYRYVYSEEADNQTERVDPVQKGQWVVYIQSPTIIEARIELIIDDETGEIVRRNEKRPKIMPKHSATEIMDLVNEMDEIVEFKKNHSVEYEYIYYYNATWYVWISGVDDSSIYSYLFVSVDDKTLEILSVDINIYYWFFRGNVLDVGAYQEVRNDAIAPEINTEEGVPLADLLEKNRPLMYVPGFTLVLTLLSLIITLTVKKQTSIL